MMLTHIAAISGSCKSFFRIPRLLNCSIHSSERLLTSNPPPASMPMCVMCFTFVIAPMLKSSAAAPVELFDFALLAFLLWWKSDPIPEKRPRCLCVSIFAPPFDVVDVASAPPPPLDAFCANVCTLCKNFRAASASLKERRAMQSGSSRV